MVEPALSRLGEEGDSDDEDNDTSHGLCELLSKVGVKDERIFAAVREVFERDPSFGAGMLANYGDVRAAPLIEKAIAEFTPNFSSLWGRSDCGVADVEEPTGGRPCPELRERIDGWLAEWDAVQRRSTEASPRPSQRKSGRNEPCPCGSGKKYKKCCLASDEAARPRVVAPTGGGLHDSAGRGPAKQMADYAQPIIDATDGELRGGAVRAEHGHALRQLRSGATRKSDRTPSLTWRSVGRGGPPRVRADGAHDDRAAPRHVPRDAQRARGPQRVFGKRLPKRA